MRAVMLFFVFWISALAFYYKTAGAGFVADTTGWFSVYRTEGWGGLLHTFGDKSLHYVYQSLLFLGWKLFGMNGTAWMLLFVTLHAAVAALSFHVFSHLFSRSSISAPRTIAFTGSCLFLVSPYLTEPLVWYACIHYLAVTLLILTAFRAVLFYVDATKPKYIVLFFACYFISLFTLEISFILPVMLLVFFLFWPAEIFNGVQRLRLIKIFVLPGFLLLCGYFLLSSVLRGSIVGHYGTAEHFNMDLGLLMGNLAKYISKIFFFSQFADYRMKVFPFFENAKFGKLFFVLLLLLAIAFVWFWKHLSKQLKISALLFAFFILGLSPILTLYVSFITNVEGDRFAYFATVFAGQFIAFVCIAFFRRVGWLLLAVYLVFEIKFLVYNTISWQKCKEVNHALVKNYQWGKEAKVFLLNPPDNFRGVYLYRSYPPESSFYTIWSLNSNQVTDSTSVHEVLLYNMQKVTDSVFVERVSDNELKVTFAQGGNWWWRKGIGASNYETDDYMIMIDPWGLFYKIKFKRKIPGAIYLYQCGKEWRRMGKFN